MPVQAVSVREQMLEQQVRAWDVLDERVLNAMRAVPRELFVPAPQRFRAYADAEVPLPHGQHMLRPSVSGRILQALLPRADEAALEIGAGTGFLTACLRGLAGSVRALEIFPELADAARSNLAALGVTGAEVVDADAMQSGALGGPAAARYGVIALSGSLPRYDERFERLLALGGRLFVVVGEAPVMEARLVRRLAEDQFRSESLFETVIDPLINAVPPPPFTF
jgi:protein-L-isoaspartate(D-aspartate) O-methyltransferase